MTSPLTSHMHAAPDAHAGLDQFDAAWDVAERALQHLRRLPAPMLHAWAAQPLGHIVVGPDESRYEPETVLWRDLRTNAVIFINATHVTERTPDFWIPIGAWIDHWLGSGGAVAGARLSDGESFSTPPLDDAASRLQRVLGRRYAENFLDTTDYHEIFARGFGWMMIDQQTLSAADPHLAKWFRSTILRTSFWKQFARESQRD